MVNENSNKTGSKTFKRWTCETNRGETFQSRKLLFYQEEFSNDPENCLWQLVYLSLCSLFSDDTNRWYKKNYGRKMHKMKLHKLGDEKDGGDKYRRTKTNTCCNCEYTIEVLITNVCTWMKDTNIALFNVDWRWVNRNFYYSNVLFDFFFPNKHFCILFLIYIIRLTSFIWTSAIESWWSMIEIIYDV